MPDQNLKTNVTFNRDEIRAKPEAQEFDFRKARRVQGPIYSALVRELYEEGCVTTAKYFQKLVDKEDKLLAGRVIPTRVCEERNLLLQLYENVKFAEKAARLGKCAGKLASMKLLYQSVLLLEEYKNNFDWILGDFYDIVAHTTRELNPNEIAFNEIKMRFNYKYGSYLAQKDERMEQAMEVLQISLNICGGQSWRPDTNPEVDKYETMHEAVARKLAKVTLAYAKLFLNTNPEFAMKLSYDAILILAQIGLEKNKRLVCEAYIANIDFMIECHKFEMALEQIERVQEHITKDVRFEFVPLKCMIFIQKGICYYNLNDLPKALLKFRQAFTISRKYDIKELEGRILLQMGKTHAKTPRLELRARECFTAAQRIFIEQGDHKNKKTADYMLAKLKADQILPAFMSMMKSKDYCQFYNLRQWKNQCKPFWHEQANQMQLNVSDELWSTDSGSNTQEMVYDEQWLQKQLAVEEEYAIEEESVGEEVTENSSKSLTRKENRATHTAPVYKVGSTFMVTPLLRPVTVTDLTCLTHEFEEDQFEAVLNLEEEKAAVRKSQDS